MGTRREKRIDSYQARIARAEARQEDYTFPAQDPDWLEAERRYHTALNAMTSRLRYARQNDSSLVVYDYQEDYVTAANRRLDLEEAAAATPEMAGLNPTATEGWGADVAWNESRGDDHIDKSRVLTTEQETEVRRIAKEEWDRRDEIDMSGILAVVQARVAVDVAEAIDTYDTESEPRVVDLINVALAKAWADASTFGDKTYQPDGRVIWKDLPTGVTATTWNTPWRHVPLTEAEENDAAFNLQVGNLDVPNEDDEIAKSHDREDAPTIKSSITRNPESLYEEVRLLRALNTDLLNLLRFDGRL